MNLDKRSVFEEGLSDPSVEVHLIEAVGLVAPADLEYPTMFRYGLNMPIPIPDLVCDDLGIKATLSFNQWPHETFVPWAAVVAIVLPNRGIAISWATDAPSSTPSLAPVPSPTKTPPPTPSPITKKPSLKLV